MSTRDLERIPRVGWVREATPITPVPRLAKVLGVSYVGVKRDDLCEPLYGGCKPRKLDYLLAAPPFDSASAWASVGGIGSGHLVALTAAAERLERRVRAHMFWTPPSPSILDNLAFVASGPTDVTFHGSRAALALRHPTLLLGVRSGDVAVVPAGATTADGMLGLVRAGLELAEQVRAGELPEPELLFVALGSGGTAAGLSLGLSMGGLRTQVVAVAVVERALSARWRMDSLQTRVASRLEAAGVAPPGVLPEVIIDHSQLGAGYGVTTRASLAACASLTDDGLELEPTYTGKAMAALLASTRGGGPVLFWHTARRSPLPHREDWRERLPGALRERLELPAGRRFTRRRAVIGAALATAAIGLGLRITGYAPRPGWRGAIMGAWEAEIVDAAADVILPPDAGAALGSVAERVDRFLQGMPAAALRDVHGMLLLIEHATTPLGGGLHRFTRLDPAARDVFLRGLDARGGLLAQAYRGLRDLCLVAYYQQPSSWELLGYDGPRVASADEEGPRRAKWPAYYDLVAPRGSLPRGVVT